ncbi:MULTISPECIES: hypothetical protein [Clostridia]|nr:MULTISPECIES: hypothetical protein [Clostridia]
MLAMLFATYIIRGLWEYQRVPNVLKEDVDAILVAEGREDLIKR